MTTRQLGFQAPPTLAIAAGAVSPNPGIAGVQVWSSTAGAILVWDGNSWGLLNSAGTGGGAFTSANIDGGAASAVYLASQQINGGGANG